MAKEDNNGSNQKPQSISKSSKNRHHNPVEKGYLSKLVEAEFYEEIGFIYVNCRQAELLVLPGNKQ